MKLEIDYNKKNGKKHKYMDTIQHATKKNNGSMKKSKTKIRKYLETNENKNTTFQNLWDTATAILRGKFIAIQVYLKK